MKTNTSISVTNISKLYKIYNKPSDMLKEVLTGKPLHKSFWALRDINFEVPQGRVVGILGRNGAGKSTLLKIITGTLDATSGNVVVNGNISSILELGTGFNQEYSGRENVYLGGLMIGMSKEEVLDKMDWIIDFSELKEVIDQPFKTYSTGMQARLTFSTAVCIEPDVLIIDEALAVGDAKFARKCYHKINEFRSAGHTILLVSHDINTIANLCDHAILLEKGMIYEQGEPFRIGQVYYEMLFATTQNSELAEPGKPEKPDSTEGRGIQTEESGNQMEEIPIVDHEQTPTRVIDPEILYDFRNLDNQSLQKAALEKLGLVKPFNQQNTHQARIGNGIAEILDFGIMDTEGKRTTLLVSGNRYTFFFRVLFYEDVGGATFGFVIRNSKGVDLYGTSSHIQKLKTTKAERGALLEIRCQVTMWLTNGTYFLTYAVANPYAENDVQYDMLYDALQFDVRVKDGIFTYSSVNLDAEEISRKVLFGKAELIEEDMDRVAE